MHIYSPAIKAKPNDITALMLLSGSSQTNIKPLIETPIIIENSTSSTQISNSVNAIIKLLPEFPFYFDALDLESSERKLFGFEELAKSGLAFTPTTSLDCANTDKDKLRILLEKYNLNICIRLELEDLNVASEDTWVKIIELSSALGIPPSRLDLILDFKYINRPIDTLEDHAVTFLSLQPKKFKPGSITLLAGSALKDVGGIKIDSVASIPRKEIELWLNLNYEFDGLKNIGFGDYGVFHPEFAFGGPNKNANAKIRYTAGSMTHYFRGHCLYPSDFGQYHELAMRVIDSGHYMGSDFSYGDHYIYQCAHREIGTGNLATWLKADLNHHAEITAKQISKIKSELHSISKKSEVMDMIASI